MSELNQKIELEQLSPARADQLARIVEAGLISQGRVFLLSLEPVRQEMGRRWAARCDIVWETMFRNLARQMPPPDIFLQIDDVTVLAAIVSVDSYDARVRCGEALSSTLVFFLGRAAREDLRLSCVSSLEGGVIRSEPVDHLTAPPPPAVRSGPRDQPPEAPKTPEDWSPPLGGRRFAGAFLSERQGAVSLTFEIVPVWRLDQGFISAYAIRRRLPMRIHCLTDADRNQIAHLTADHLIPILEQYRREGGLFAIMAPVPFSVVSNNRHRQQLLARGSALADVMQRCVLLEVDSFGVGAPMGRITDTAAMVRPFFRALTASVRDASDCATALGEYAFNGIAIEAAGMDRERLSRLIRSARRRSPNVTVHDAADADDEWLRELGVSHVTRVEARDAVAAGVTIRGASARA